MIKAALIEKFSNYIEWPKDSPFNNSTKIRVGLVGNSEFGESLKEIYKGIKLKGKDVEVLDVKTDNQNLPQILILGELDNKEFSKLINQIKNKPILVITDLEKYSEAGAHISFFLSEEGNIRFKFNKKTFDETGMYVSHLLLRYAEFVD